MSFCWVEGKKKSMVASHILIRSVSRVYENTYLLMCLFLLAVEIPLTNKTPLVFQGRLAGFDPDIVYCVFSRVLW